MKLKHIFSVFGFKDEYKYMVLYKIDWHYDKPLDFFKKYIKIIAKADKISINLFYGEKHGHALFYVEEQEKEKGYNYIYNIARKLYAIDPESLVDLWKSNIITIVNDTKLIGFIFFQFKTGYVKLNLMFIEKKEKKVIIAFKNDLWQYDELLLKHFYTFISSKNKYRLVLMYPLTSKIKYWKDQGYNWILEDTKCHMYHNLSDYKHWDKKEAADIFNSLRVKESKVKKCKRLDFEEFRKKNITISNVYAGSQMIDIKDTMMNDVLYLMQTSKHPLLKLYHMLLTLTDEDNEKQEKLLSDIKKGYSVEIYKKIKHITSTLSSPDMGAL
jgi:hypothetical protein